MLATSICCPATARRAPSPVSEAVLQKQAAKPAGGLFGVTFPELVAITDQIAMYLYILTV